MFLEWIVPIIDDQNPLPQLPNTPKSSQYEWRAR